MGCVSSKLLKKNLKQELLFGNGDVPNHVVSLTSSTLGVLKLDQSQNLTKTQVVVFPSSSNIQQKNKNNVGKSEDNKKEEIVKKVGVFGSKRLQSQEELEVINTWELMEDLEDGAPVKKKSPGSTPGFRVEKGEMSPFKRLISQKENKCVNVGIDVTKKQQCYSTPRSGALKSWKFSSNSTNNKLRKVGTSLDSSPRRSNVGVSNSRRKSLGPLFDPELIDSLEKELSLENNNEQIKEMVSPKLQKSSKLYSSSSNLLKNYVEKCPPGGENCVVIYTTTLRGIRKTFEDCNVVRSVVGSYNVRVIERDVSMDSGFKEEVRKMMSTKEVKVPLVFVKGRLIGGAEEVVKLDEEGTLQKLLQGISKGLIGCDGCGGIRFVLCMDCNGSCKVLDESKKSMVKCDECNENGLIQCPICC